MTYLYIYLIGLIAWTIFMIYRHFSGEYDVIPFYIEFIFTLIYPFIILWWIYDYLFPARYMHYFDKEDSPYRQDFQPKSKYHKVWKRNKYSDFLRHKTIKIKWFDLITIYKIKEVNKDE